MGNKNMLSQAIRFQRTVLQNSLTIISTVQQHNEQILRATLEQSPWIPANGKKACLFWTDVLTKNMSAMSHLADQSLANMEQYSYTSAAKPEQEKPERKASAKPQAPPRPSTAGKAAPARKAASAKPQTAKKSRPAAQPAVALAAEVKTAAAKKPDINQATTRQPSGKTLTAEKNAGPENPA